jgi:4-amino-4-deoxy-L-arabinose transferase-like glycosyltransferase
MKINFQKIKNSLLNFVKSNKILLIIFILAIISGFFWNHRFYFRPGANGGDEWQYTCLAKGMLENHVYNECGRESYLEPGYPLFLSVIFSLFGYNLEIVRFIQLVMFGLMSVLIYKLGKELFGKRVGFIAGLFSSLWWVFANSTGMILRETLLPFLMIILFFCLYRSVQSGKNKYFVASGILIGLVSLTNAIFQYFIILAVINFLLVLRKKINFKSLIIKLFLLIVSFFIVLSPWLIRNEIYYAKNGATLAPRAGHMLTIRVNFMETLYPNIYKYFVGHLFGYYFAEKIYPGLDSNAFQIFAPANKLMNDLTDQGYDMSQASKILTDRAIKTIIAEPHKYVLIALLDFISFNSPLLPQKIFGGNNYVYFTFADGRYGNISGWFKAGTLIIFRSWWYLFLFLVGYGIYRNFKNWDKVGWMILFIVYFNFVYSAIYAIPRYAVQIYPFYIVLASASFVYFFERFRGKFLNKKDGNT